MVKYIEAGVAQVRFISYLCIYSYPEFADFIASAYG